MSKRSATTFDDGTRAAGPDACTGLAIARQPHARAAARIARAAEHDHARGAFYRFRC